jgi:parallel beta-helix repeat protein
VPSISPASIDSVQEHFEPTIAVSQNTAMRWRARLPCRRLGAGPAWGWLALAMLVSGLAPGCGETEPAPPLGGIGGSSRVSCDVYAATQGSDSASGARATPLRSPERLLATLDPGETGCFRGGTYAFSALEITTPGVTLAAYRDEEVTLEGEIKVKPAGHDSTIEGMKLDSRDGATPIGPRIYADHVTLRDNEITNGHVNICVLLGRFYSRPPPQGVLIERNRIHDCGALPSTNKDHGIYVSEARGTVIRDNWIYDNADRGIQLYPDADESTITGNVIDSNGEGIVFAGTRLNVSSNNVVTGNVISNPKLGWNAYSNTPGPPASGNLFRHNCLWAGDANSPFDSDGGVEASSDFTARANVVVDPRYVDRDAHDYSLSRESECPLAGEPGFPALNGSG